MYTPHTLLRNYTRGANHTMTKVGKKEGHGPQKYQDVTKKPQSNIYFIADAIKKETLEGSILIPTWKVKEKWRN